MPKSALEKPWSQKASGLVAALSHPPPTEMHSPANRLAHRHRPAAAGTEITLVGVRKGGFTCSKIAINDLIVGDPRQAAADSAFGADDLFTFACDQHPGVPWCTRSACTVNPSGGRAVSLVVSVIPRNDPSLRIPVRHADCSAWLNRTAPS